MWNANMFMSPLTISLCAMLYLQAITVYRAAVVVYAGMPTLIKCSNMRVDWDRASAWMSKSGKPS